MKKKEFINIVKKGSFIKSTLTLMSGSIIAQMMAVMISPALTRLYSEKEIGEYTLILTAVSMFGSVICLRYDMSIVPEEDESKVFVLIKLSFIIAAILSMLIGMGYALYCFCENNLEMNSGLVFFWVSILLFFTGAGQILIAHNNRYKEYKLITSVSIIREVGRDITLIVLGLLRFGTVGLLISQVISVFLGLNRQSASLRKKKIVWKNISNAEMKVAIKKYISQPLYSVPANFINSFSYSVLNLLVGNLFGMSELAYYSMSYRMLGVPLTLVGTNMSRVFFERASREYEQKKSFRKTLLFTTVLLAIVAIPMVIVLLVFAPRLFSIFFGSSWGKAGEYVRILAPMFGIRLVISALTPAMIIVRKQNLELIMQSLFLLVIGVVYILFKDSNDIGMFLTGISGAFSLVYLFYYVVILIYSKNKEDKSND